MTGTHSDQCWLSVNSLAPGRPGCHFKTAIFNLVLLIGIFTSSKDNALIWMPRDLTDDKSTLVQVMAWCRQAASHYLSQCWPSSMSPYGITRPQWVNVTPIIIFQSSLRFRFFLIAAIRIPLCQMSATANTHYDPAMSIISQIPPCWNWLRIVVVWFNRVIFSWAASMMF